MPAMAPTDESAGMNCALSVGRQAEKLRAEPPRGKLLVVAKNPGCKQDAAMVNAAIAAASVAGDDLIVCCLKLRDAVFNPEDTSYIQKIKERMMSSCQLGDLASSPHVTLSVMVEPAPMDLGNEHRLQAGQIMQEAHQQACTGIIVRGKPSESRMRRLLGTSVGALLAREAEVPVLYWPGQETTVQHAGAALPASFRALQVANLQRDASEWQIPSASAA